MQNRIAGNFPDVTINIVALCDGYERYIVLYADELVVEAKRTLGRWASNPELSFTWHNAADLCVKMRWLEHEETAIRKAR